MEYAQGSSKSYGPISGALQSYLIELAAQMQALPGEEFEAANIAYKGALAEVERVAELEKYATVTS
ncbi:hypothetical protein ACQ0P8_04170 [Halodesulfovibrio aestuarii]|uniref:Uncharacterized protein n=1 Tax=Halodesulfovibrio aestuarii TaxID=126333 RepID=A0A8G2C826_9BACT|nr:hypothetical protein [Halodesulfovibrio aestuarii]SHI74786.1 hypothetical protein SAMN05660830_00858 [Halodesulfovibrio aestuarii]